MGELRRLMEMALAFIDRVAALTLEPVVGFSLLFFLSITIAAHCHLFLFQDRQHALQLRHLAEEQQFKAGHANRQEVKLSTCSFDFSPFPIQFLCL